MKKTILILISILPLLSFGQQVNFNNEPVDTIVISSELSGYRFDKKGTTQGIAETILIKFEKENNQYIISNYQLEKYQRTYRPENFNLEKKVFKQVIGKTVDSKEIKALLTSLATPVNRKELFKQLDTTELKKNLSENQIRKVAKLYKIDWYFKSKYSTKEENDKFFKFLSSIDTVKVYLKERFDTLGYVMVTDYSNTFDIWISTQHSEYRFEGKYPNPLKQPWYYYPRKKGKYIQTDTLKTFEQPVLNLDINKTLYTLLPKNFLLRKTISTEALANDYITWYFERRDMKGKF